MRNGIRLCALLGFAFCAVYLSGCSKNPMMNEKYVSGMRGNFFLEDSSNFPIRECAKYYAGKGDPSLKSKCDKWSENYYTRLRDGGSIDSSITLEEFRSEDFWAKVESA